MKDQVSKRRSNCNAVTAAHLRAPSGARARARPTAFVLGARAKKEWSGAISRSSKPDWVIECRCDDETRRESKPCKTANHQSARDRSDRLTRSASTGQLLPSSASMRRMPWTGSTGAGKARSLAWKQWSSCDKWLMAMIPIPQDLKEFLKLLEEHRVDYLLIGGYAVSRSRFSQRSPGWTSTRPTQNGSSTSSTVCQSRSSPLNT